MSSPILSMVTAKKRTNFFGPNSHLKDFTVKMHPVRSYITERFIRRLLVAASSKDLRKQREREK